ncbi:alpha/beta hydrolase fold family protein [Mycobacterium kansasii]|uniref:Alpha/beta hydrolase fold family protein n=1 Tax=Mycobacterium kansasii TaxID=1768 RepID=A0A1V3XVV5_MYCKA|nr:alpha/beta hydrolase fold family protein [Mycobacterium kansasii]
MTKSLPGTPDLQPEATCVPMRWTRRIQSTVTGAGVKVIPWIPGPVKRLLTRGRSVVIDGNTLDPTLQLMLSGMRAVGLDGLVIDDDPDASRANMREATLGFGGPQIHVEVEELTLPGPAGDIRARHYRAPGGVAAPLLVFYHGGGWVIGDLDTHDAVCRLTCRDAGIHVLSIDYRLAPEHHARPGSTTLLRPSRGPTSMPANSVPSPGGLRWAATARAAIWRPSCASWPKTAEARLRCCSG